MSDAVLEISMSGRADERVRNCTLSLGSDAANRASAVGYLVDFRARGLTKVRVFLDGVAIRPSEEEFAPFETTRERLRAAVQETELAAMAW